MKLMIASDIHGSAYYTRKLLEKMEEEQADKLLLLGDILYHGPRNDFPQEYCPKEVFPALNAVKDKILCIQGNCDSEVDQMVLEFPIMVKNMVIEADGVTIFATHGHEYNIDCLPPLSKGTVMVYGHFHVQMCEEKDGIIVMNPGSVALPKDGSFSGYMIAENGVFTWKDIDGNVRKTYEAVR